MDMQTHSQSHWIAATRNTVLDATRIGTKTRKGIVGDCEACAFVSLKFRIPWNLPA